MALGRLRDLRRGASFTVRFAVILASLGVLIALATAAIPVQLAADEARSVALDRAADKGGIAVNLISAQRASLDTFVRGIANQLSGPLGLGDGTGVAAILQRESAVTDSRDVVGDDVSSTWGTARSFRRATRRRARCGRRCRTTGRSQSAPAARRGSSSRRRCPEFRAQLSSSRARCRRPSSIG